MPDDLAEAVRRLQLAQALKKSPSADRPDQANDLAALLGISREELFERLAELMFDFRIETDPNIAPTTATFH